MMDLLPSLNKVDLKGGDVIIAEVRAGSSAFREDGNSELRRGPG